jgi:hypothetical protein
VFNKRILKIGEKGDEVNPKGGFITTAMSGTATFSFTARFRAHQEAHPPQGPVRPTGTVLKEAPT